MSHVFCHDACLNLQTCSGSGVLGYGFLLHVTAIHGQPAEGALQAMHQGDAYASMDMHMHRARNTASQVRTQSACTQFALLIILLPVVASQQHFIPSKTNFFHALDLLLASPDLADVLQGIITTGITRG